MGSQGRIISSYAPQAGAGPTCRRLPAGGTPRWPRPTGEHVPRSKSRPCRPPAEACGGCGLPQSARPAGHRPSRQGLPAGSRQHFGAAGFAQTARPRAVKRRGAADSAGWTGAAGPWQFRSHRPFIPRAWHNGVGAPVGHRDQQHGLHRRQRHAHGKWCSCQPWLRADSKNGRKLNFKIVCNDSSC